MDNDQETCKSDNALPKTVQHSENDVPKNAESVQDITTDVENKQSGNAIVESMESIDTVVVNDTNSPIEISKGDNKTMEQKNGGDCTEAVASPIFVQQCLESCGTEPQKQSQQISPQFEKSSEGMGQGDVKIVEEVQSQKSETSLSIIALAYDNSDSESEEAECVDIKNKSETLSSEMEIEITKEYRCVPVTSDEESSSESSSSDDSSDSSPDDESVASNYSKDSAEERANPKQKNEKSRSKFYERESKSEFDDLPPIEELKISVPEVLCDPLGEVAWMVEQMVVVRPKPGKPTLNLDTILFVERGRRVLGRVFDVFGQVQDPHYCVRFNSTEHIKESDIKVGMIVYFCPNTEYTSVVFVQDLLKMKATDELGEDEHPEFSDDEEERAYYAALKQKQKGDKGKAAEEVPEKRQRSDPGWKSNHPWSSGRRHEQSHMHQKSNNTQGWPSDAQRNARNQGNSWPRYPPAYSNVSWPPAVESHGGNAWPSMNTSQNQYVYSESFGNQPPQPSPHPFFRPPPPFQSRPVPYMRGGPYPQQSNPRRYLCPDFQWQSPVPRQPPVPWRFGSPLPPPPPPPPPGM